MKDYWLHLFLGGLAFGLGSLYGAWRSKCRRPHKDA